jgi:2-hydroxy-6-oxonona-2,4-dienedioate hydrolase
VKFFSPAETGHQGQTDQPEQFNQPFLEFFREGKVSRQTADAAASRRTGRSWPTSSSRATRQRTAHLSGQ